MEYDDQNMPLDGNSSTINLLLTNLTQRQNEQAQTISDLRKDVALMAARMDEAEQMTSKEYSDQVVAQVTAAIPAIQASVMKPSKRQPTRR